MTSLAQAIKQAGKPGFNNATWQMGYVAAVHARASTTLYASAAVGAYSIETHATIAANSLIVVSLTSGAKTGPMPVQSVSGTTAPFTLVLSGPLLTGALTSGTSYTTLHVTAIPVPIPAGTIVTLTSGSSTQNWTTTAPSVIGATSLSVTSQMANANYAAGSVLTIAAIPPSGGTIPLGPTGLPVSSIPFPSGRTLPGAASSGGAVMVIPTIDVYLDGAQHVPGVNQPSGTKTSAAAFLTPGIRYLYGYTPVVGHTAVILRGSGLRKSDRIAIGRLA